MLAGLCLFHWITLDIKRCTAVRMPSSANLTESHARINTTRLMNRPGSDGGSQSMEDESHGSTQEVPRGVA